jgi:DNA-binding transcriptional LysR family regulator
LDVRLRTVAGLAREMQLEKLKTFCQVAETGGLSKAARLDGITRASAHSRLVKFERELDICLIHRQRQKNRPTAAGQLIYAYARHIVDLYEQAKAEMRNGKGQVLRKG